MDNAFTGEISKPTQRRQCGLRTTQFGLTKHRQAGECLNRGHRRPIHIGKVPGIARQRLRTGNLQGQVVGQMNQEKDCRTIMYELLEEYAHTVERLHTNLHAGEEGL